MAYTVAAQLQIALDITQTFDTTSLPASVSRAVKMGDNWKVDLSLESTSPGSSQPEIVTKGYAFKKALSAGAATVDLTSLTNVLGTSESLTGLKVQGVVFLNPSSNANAITIAKGASNGYELLGSGFTFTLQPGQTAAFRLFEASPDVGSGAKTIDLSGTASQELYIILVAG